MFPRASGFRMIQAHLLCTLFGLLLQQHSDRQALGLEVGDPILDHSCPLSNPSLGFIFSRLLGQGGRAADLHLCVFILVTNLPYLPPMPTRAELSGSAFSGC